MQIALQSAGSELLRLVEAAESGEDVVVTRAGRPVARLVAVFGSRRPVGKRVLGQGAGKIVLPSDEEWHAMDKEIEASMCDAPLCSDEAV